MQANARHLYLKSLQTENPRHYLAQVAALNFADLHELAACIVALAALTGQVFRSPHRPIPLPGEVVPEQWRRAVDLALRFDPDLDATRHIVLGTRRTGGKRCSPSFRDDIPGSGPSNRTTSAPLHELAEAQVVIHEEDKVRMRSRDRQPGVRLECKVDRGPDDRQYSVTLKSGHRASATIKRHFVSTLGLRGA